MQAAKRSDPANRDRDDARHAWHDSPVQQDPAPGQLADVDQVGRPLIAAPAPTEPQVTDVTPTSTSRVRERDHQRLLAGVRLQPPPCLLIQGDDERLVRRIIS